jgi:GT2 family glycosyltransferase
MIPQVSIIIVNWNTKDLLRDCLRSIYSNTPCLEFDVFVVDNFSSDGSVDMIESEFPQVNLIKNGQNLGYSKANNQAIKIAKGKYILLLNPDTFILDKAINKTVDFLEANSKVGVVGCKTLNSDGTFQQSWARFPDFRTILFGRDTLKTALSTFNIWRRIARKIGENNACVFTTKVDWVMGHFMMVRRMVIDRVGLLDENNFMFGEEFEWCYRIAKNGWQIWFLSEAAIIHYGGQSTFRCPKEEVILWHLLGDYNYFYRHFGVLKTFTMYFVILFSSIFKIILFGVSYPFLTKDRNYLKYRITWHWYILKCNVTTRVLGRVLTGETKQIKSI